MGKQVSLRFEQGEKMTSLSMKSRQCPSCQQTMVFAPDGRALLCERCGQRQEVVRQRPAPEEIAAGQVCSGTLDDEEYSRFRGNIRDLLIKGIVAAKAGDRDEAFFYLEWVLRKRATDKEQAQAWLWLSQVYDEPAHRRECLSYALARDPANVIVRRELAILDGRLKAEEIVDPDQIVVKPAEQTVVAQAKHFQCPRCSGRVNYTADARSLVCDFCGFRQELNETAGMARHGSEYGIGAMEQDFIAALATARGHLRPISMRSFQCQGCAVEFALGPETLSITCPYCDSVYVTEVAETREILPPQGLIPFLVSQDEAKKTLQTWFKRQKLGRIRLSPLVGIYLPVWTFDVSGEIKWRGKERKGDNWVPVSGVYYLLQDDILVPASPKLPRRLAKMIQDFDLEQLVAYDARYLADWPAERYQIALAEASLLARKLIFSQLRHHPINLTGGRAIRDLGLSSRGVVVDSFKLILLPVWMAHYQVEERPYDVIVNGQNGRVRGEKAAGVVGKLVSWLRGE
jgi:DNA-directed RNA polymerase subunit RPC12/RpoP